MNKKFLLALALPAVMVGCSQEDLVSEGVVATAPAGKAIDNVVFNIAKNADANGVESRADWVNNKIKFEASDKVSLYWLGDDGYSINTTSVDGSFNHSLQSLTAPLIGHSNAVFRTEDGSKFTAEAVVYEGYNLLVYPSNVKHTTAVEAEVSLPKTQKAAEDFAENAIYIGDSILHIHQPAINKNRTNGKEYGAYYDIYGNKATTEDANTSGYAHGVKTGVKLLTSLLNMDLRINNAPANDVVIKKVVLTTANEKKFNQWGNLSPRGREAQSSTPRAEIIANLNGSGSKAIYTNPWFKVNEDGKADAVTLSFEGVATNVSGSTKGTMLLLPTNMSITKDANGVYSSADQPVLKVYTNYGVVTVGGAVATDDAQTNVIYKKDGIEKAAVDDNQALLEIAYNATNYVDKSLKIYDADDTVDGLQDYAINSGVSMTRVIKVDMAKAEMIGMEASTTEELNAILNAAIKNPNNKFAAANKLEVKLMPNADEEFVLTNYEGLDAFVNKFKAGALTLSAGTNTNGTTGTVVVNTTSATELKNVEGLATAMSLTIPATSKINAIKNGADANHKHTVNNAIVNKSTITVPANAVITLADNEEGKVIYTKGATIAHGTGLVDDNYGIIYYEAATKGNFTTAVAAGVNYVKIEGLGNAFFADGLSNAGKTALTGLTIEFSNCGKLNETVETGTISTETIVLSNGTSYPNLTNASVDKIVVKSATAELGYPKNSTNTIAKTIDAIEIAEGTTTIKYLDIETLTIKEGATADMDKNTEAPEYFNVFGTANFTGSNNQVDEKVFTTNTSGKITAIAATENAKCIVTGTLNLAKDLAYAGVAVSETTKITVAEGVKGLGYTTVINVTKAGQETGTANLYTFQAGSSLNTAVRYSWDGKKVGTIQWGF